MPTCWATSKARTTRARRSLTASAPRRLDAFLPGLLDKADRIPGKSLLFNIDQKATLISKDQTDALLKVFVKVFDESRGYYGNQGHVARFERDLDNRGQYQAFQEAFERIAGIPWIQGREQSALEGPSIDRAFAEVNGGTADGIIQQYSASYSVSIEDFADEVKSWLDEQGDPTFRLNFFVDEVGQFIGSDTKLMLNLQTIAESLNTKCAGRSWVFVTSQEDMEKVIGDRTRQQGNDFSKIQARFKTRLKLTSADVEEVIRKRLLEKNDAGASRARARSTPTSTPTSRRCSTSSTEPRPTATTPTSPTSSAPTRSSATSSRCSRPQSRASPTTTSSRAATARSVSARCSASSSRSPRTSATSRSASSPPSTACSPASAPP